MATRPWFRAPAMRVRTTLMTSAVALAFVASGCAPPQPATGLGAEGPCTQTTTSFANPTDATQTVNVFLPTGNAATPITGGTCGDGKRPVVFYSHGFAGAFTFAYAETITHLVSTGNIVVFSSYNADIANPLPAYEVTDAGNVAAAASTPRADLGRVGFMGHSLGGGMLPFLVQRGAQRGWGNQARWLFGLAAYFAYNVGKGPIALPANTRVLMAGFDNDTIVDNRIAIEIFNALSVPASQKQHVMVRSQTRGTVQLQATHLSPLTVVAPNDAIHFFGIFRNADALETCALSGTNCNADLTFMGTWSDGVPVTPAISTDTPSDLGPIATTECDGGLAGILVTNPRGTANCGPSRT